MPTRRLPGLLLRELNRMSSREFLHPLLTPPDRKDHYEGCIRASFRSQPPQKTGSVCRSSGTAALFQPSGSGSVPAAPGRCRRSPRLALACCCLCQAPHPPQGGLCPLGTRQLLKRGLERSRLSNAGTRLGGAAPAAEAQVSAAHHQLVLPGHRLHLPGWGQG